MRHTFGHDWAKRFRIVHIDDVNAKTNKDDNQDAEPKKDDTEDFLDRMEREVKESVGNPEKNFGQLHKRAEQSAKPFINEPVDYDTPSVTVEPKEDESPADNEPSDADDTEEEQAEEENEDIADETETKPVVENEEGRRLLDAYRRHLEGYMRPQSVKTYSHTVEKFMEFIGWDVKEFTARNADDFIGRYLDGVNANGTTVSAASRNRRIAALHSFGEWLIKPMEIIASNPMDDIKRARVPVRLPKFLSEKELDRLLNSQDTTTPKGVRDRALLEFFACTGCRVSEVAGLTWDMIDIKSRTVRIIGKGNKERLVYLADDCVDWLRKYRDEVWARWKDELIKHRTEKGDDADDIAITDRVFVNSCMTPCDKVMLYRLVSHAGHTAHIKQKVYPHLLRHSFGTKMVRNGANIIAVKELMGHASVATTQVYVAVTEDDKRDAVMAVFNKKNINNE
ncbi:MAG: tyrosine-type recombinase/integrase [Victivallales bacterium]|nr:tyrosine-type recombinase/integrase [Victivallales bacterium]